MPEFQSNGSGFKQFVQAFLNHSFQSPLRYGIGCAWVGRGERYRKHLKADLKMLETAFQLGFRYFDTAPYYSNSEFVVGEFVRTIHRESIFLATKFNLAKGFTPSQASEHTRKSLAESLRRLQTDHLDLFQIHDVDTLENVLAKGGVLEVLRQLKQDGIIRYSGLATRWHPLLRQAALHGEFDTILTYSDYTPFRQTAAPLIDLAASRGVGVINASPLTGAHERNVDLTDTRILGGVLSYPLQNPGIDINLTGPSNSAEIRASTLALGQEVDRTLWEKWALTLFTPGI